jgi:hypothetical protein
MGEVIPFDDGNGPIEVVSSEVTSVSQFVHDGTDVVQVKIWKKEDDETWPKNKSEVENLWEKLRARLLLASDRIERGQSLNLKALATDLRAVSRLIKKY